MSTEKMSLGDNPTLADFHEKATQHDLPGWIKDHLRAYEESPAIGHFWDASSLGGDPRTPTLLLTTVGRKSGRVLTMPLLYGRDGDRYVIIGSKGGAPQHPAWYFNLQANPVVDVQIAEDKFRANTRTVSGEERERLFKMMTTVYPAFPAYQQRTERELPVVVLERI